MTKTETAVILVALISLGSMTLWSWNGWFGLQPASYISVPSKVGYRMKNLLKYGRNTDASVWGSWDYMNGAYGMTRDMSRQENLDSGFQHGEK